MTEFLYSDEGRLAVFAAAAVIGAWWTNRVVWYYIDHHPDNANNSPIPRDADETDDYY